MRKPVVFIQSSDLIQEVDKIPKVKCRSSMVSSLIQSFDLTSKLLVIEPRRASKEELMSFHSSEYIEYLEKSNENDESLETFGLGYDCPPISNIMDFMYVIGGASLTAAEALTKGTANISVNWFGGWHHAQRDSASGFCYVNDIVLAITALRSKFDKVLYIDLDVHHGDGVENAFNFTPKVFTFSIHKYETGYFPGTGNVSDIGQGKGRYYSANCPLKNGIDDQTYFYIFTNLFDEICYGFKPDAIVCQCGGDALANDPLGGFNLTFSGLGSCINKILTANKPTLFLGGGGYNLNYTAMYWTYLTALITGTEIPLDIPDSDKYFLAYGPAYELDISPSLRNNENTPQEIEDLLAELFENLENVSC